MPYNKKKRSHQEATATNAENNSKININQNSKKSDRLATPRTAERENLGMQRTSGKDARPSPLRETEEDQPETGEGPRPPKRGRESYTELPG